MPSGICSISFCSKLRPRLGPPSWFGFGGASLWERGSGAVCYELSKARCCVGMGSFPGKAARKTGGLPSWFWVCWARVEQKRPNTQGPSSLVVRNAAACAGQRVSPPVCSRVHVVWFGCLAAAASVIGVSQDMSRVHRMLSRALPRKLGWGSRRLFLWPSRFGKKLNRETQ